MDERSEYVPIGPDWRGLGCKSTRRVGGQGHIKGGRAAWRLRAPRRSREDWAIEVGHCPYLGVHPYEYGPDAWRISIQVPDPLNGERHMEVAHLVTTSETEAFDAVTWLDVAAASATATPDVSAQVTRSSRTS